MILISYNYLAQLPKIRTKYAAITTSAANIVICVEKDLFTY